MSIPLIINGQTFQYPETGDNSWGLAATSWAAAVTSGMLQKAGGAFTLLAEVDFGATYGLKSTYFKSRTSTPAAAGQLRLAKTDNVSWKNNAGDGDLALAINGSDALTFNGVALGNFVSVLDTNSIDLTLAAGVLSAALKLSSTAAGAGFFKVTNTVETDGLLSLAEIATGSQTGFLSSTDWTTFNSKQAAGSYITALTGNVTASGPGSVAATIAAGVIVNSMVSASAGIDFSKLATLTSGNILVGSAGNVATSVTMSGDATIIASGALTIANNAVTNAKAAQMLAHTFKGNNTGSTANAIDLTATQLTAELNVMTGDGGSGGLKGLVPAQASGDATKFLSGAGTWTNPAGSGDVVGPASAVNNNLAAFDGVTGKLLKDSGVLTANVVQGPASATADAVVLYDGTTGKLIKDSAKPYTQIYLQNTTLVTNIRGSEGGGTVTLTIADNPSQRFNLSSAETVKLPTTSVLAGQIYTISNPNAFLLTIQASDASAITTSIQTEVKIVALINTPVANTDWTVIEVISTGLVRSVVRVNTANGYGSGGTKIRRFTNIVTNTGDAITYTDNSTNGGSFTINQPGTYGISYSDSFNGVSEMGISLNSNQLSTSIVSITITDILAILSSAAANFGANCGWSGPLAIGDVIRAHDDGLPVGANASKTQFTIAKLS